MLVYQRVTSKMIHEFSHIFRHFQHFLLGEPGNSNNGWISQRRVAAWRQRHWVTIAAWVPASHCAWGACALAHGVGPPGRCGAGYLGIQNPIGLWSMALITSCNFSIHRGFEFNLCYLGGRLTAPHCRNSLS